MSKPKARGPEALDSEYGAVDVCECVGPFCRAPTPGLAARPDLSHLPYEARLLIAIEQAVRTAAWWRGEDPVSDSIDDTAWRLGSAVLRDSGDFVYTAPNPLHDPAAWGSLLEKYHLEADSLSGAWKAGWLDARFIPTWGPWRKSIGEAVCLAVLAKRGFTVAHA